MAVSPVRRAFVILLSAAAVVVFGLLFAQDQETLRPRSAFTVDDPRFAPYLAALVGADLTRGNRYDVLTNGDQIFPAMLKAIDQARRVTFETAIYDTGTVANQFTAGAQRGREGGMQPKSTPWASSMERPGPASRRRLLDRALTAPVSRGGQLDASQDPRRRRHGRLHRRSAGVADHWLGNAHGTHWRTIQ